MNYGPGFEFPGRVPNVGFAHDVVAIENRICLMAGNFPSRLLRHAGEWQIGDSCQAPIETLPMLTRDEKKPEDGIKFEGDDPLDATRYLLYSRCRAKQAPQQERMEERVKAAGFTDSTSEMIWRRRWQHEEKRKSQPILFARRGINRRKKVTY